MGRTLSYLIIFVSAVGLISISVARPHFLSDQNAFLREFINHEFLNVLGLILAITLASVANIHLAFNRIEERHKTRGALLRSRQNLKKSSYWLIALFVVGAMLVVVKPIACSSDLSEALFNSASLVVLIWHVLILVSLTELVFRIEPEFPDD